MKQITSLSSNITDFIEVILAQLFEKFKLKSPIVAFIILSILGVCNIIANYGEQMGIGIFNGNQLIANIVSIGSLVFGYLIQSKTFNILNKDVNKEVINNALENKKIELVINPEETPLPEPQKGSILYGINTTPIGYSNVTRTNDTDRKL